MEGAWLRGQERASVKGPGGPPWRMKAVNAGSLCLGRRFICAGPEDGGPAWSRGASSGS